MIKAMKNFLLLIILSFLGINFSFSQNYLGLAQSNFSGALGAYKNPGFLADNRMKFDMTLAGFSVAGYNNHLYMNTRFMPNYWHKAFDSNNADSKTWLDDPHFDKIVEADSVDYYNNVLNAGNFFTYDNPDNDGRNAFVNLNVDILDMMITLSETRAIGIGIKHRTMVNLQNLAPEIITLSTNELDYPSLFNLDLSDQLLNVSANSWMEYNLSYAQVFKNDGEHFFKGGLKVKILQGLGAAYMYTDNVDYSFSNSDTAAYIRGDFEYGYASDLGSYIEPLNGEVSTNSNGNPQPTFNDIYKFASKLGLGFDIGGVYEWRPDWKDHKYDMDNETGDLSRNFKMDANVLDIAAFKDVEGFRSFDTVLVALSDSGQLIFDNDEGSFYMNLPTAINMNIDYKIAKFFYANFDASYGFQMKKNPHKTTVGSHVAVTPRFEMKWWGASLPVSVGQYTGFRTGLGLRLGPVHIGTADLKPLLAPGKDRNVRGADFYFALKVPIPYAKVKDIDGDKVSDKVEKKHRKMLRKESGNKKETGCIDVPGVWEFQGCPDTDGDHIQDSKDSCKLVAGIAEFNGCPDTDGDKIIDKLDACPQDSGLVEFDGCPDRDGDGIKDSDDLCPDDSGLVEFDGCPDRDADGVKDSDDLCPDNAGPEENNGCPDTDKDGVFDFLDECPDIAGPKENKGCPWPDTDEDGILDKDDKCPLNAGPEANDGCPYEDTDKDGVLDKEDECPNTPGTVENNGCPELDDHDADILDAAFDNLEFETGRAVIAKSSFESLDSLAALLNKRQEWKLEITGHTDNVGSAQGNLILSKKRSQAVADYLNRNGIQESRSIVKYFGEEKPIADNKTKEGRQKNRRVEMKVIFE